MANEWIDRKRSIRITYRLVVFDGFVLTGVVLTGVLTGGVLTGVLTGGVLTGAGGVSTGVDEFFAMEDTEY